MKLTTCLRKIIPDSNSDYLSSQTQMMPHANVLGVRINAIDPILAVDFCDQLISHGEQGYVCVTGVHGVMEAQSDEEIRSILNCSFLSVPDGMPTVWVGRLQGHRQIRRVYGPDFMLKFCQHSLGRGYRHFLYGGNVGICDELSVELCRRFPGLNIVGTYTPPFRPLRSTEVHELIALVRSSRPDVIWVGLSTPKQERFMAQYLEQLDTKLMVGVGAAFDIITGNVCDAPNWVKAAGLQWFHRLCQEPGRLWKRYLINNPRFLLQVVLQLSNLRRYSLEPKEIPPFLKPLE